MLDFLHHLLVPHEGNNHRAKLLHNSSILATIVALLSIQLLLVSVRSRFSNVLGITTDISATQLLVLTNKDREAQGGNDLVINSQLSQAAYEKAQDMFKKDYWAHNSPDGLTPWVFIKKSGYEYVYAGENLARGFTTSNDVVTAWMNSPSHRENMLSPNYRDVGFAIVPGKLLGEDTTLVVEEFGGKDTVIAQTQPPVEQVPAAPNVRSAITSIPIISKNFPLVDSSSLAWTISFFVLCVFIFVLVLDMIVVERHKVVRFVGHNIDHIFYLASILIFILIFSKGVI